MTKEDIDKLKVDLYHSNSEFFAMWLILFLMFCFISISFALIDDYESERKPKTRMQERNEKRIIWEKNNYILPKDTVK